MGFIGNLLWFVFGGGLLTCLMWYAGGALLAITIIGIPFAKASFRIARFAALPFGKELIDGRLVGEERKTGTGLVNFLWIVFAGLWLAITHATVGIIQCCTIIGIPFGMANFKLAKVSFAPLGKRVVSSAVAKEALKRAAKKELDEKLGE